MRFLMHIYIYMNISLLLNFNIFIIPFINFLYLFLRINFIKTKLFFTRKDKKLNFFNNNNNMNLYIIIQLYYVILFFNFFWSFKSYNNYFLVNNNYYFLINLLLILLLIFFKFNDNNNIHWLLGLYLNIITSFLFLVINDFLTIYIVLELNAYLFLYITITQLFFVKKNQKISIINSALINFILNFFSSIFFFISLYYFYFFDKNLNNDNFINSFFLIFFLIKISLGPWLFMGFEIYKGLFINSLLVYTVIFMVVILPKFLDIFINLTFINLILFLPILFYGIFLIYTINYINSFKVFLSYSTSLTTLYLFFVLLSII